MLRAQVKCGAAGGYHFLEVAPLHAGSILEGEDNLLYRTLRNLRQVFGLSLPPDDGNRVIIMMHDGYTVTEFERAVLSELQKHVELQGETCLGRTNV